MMALFKNAGHAATRIKQAKELLKKKDPMANGVAVHIKKGKELKVSTGPCHGFIRGDGSPNSVAIVSLLVRTCSHRKQASREVVVRYCDWLFNRSPWARCYKYKSAEHAYNERSCVIDVNSPANLMQGALISTRNTWEYERNINLWYALVTQYGVDEDIAFLASFFVSVSGTSVRPTGICHDHVAISSSNMAADGARAFLRNEPLFLQEPYNKGGCFQGVHKAFDGSGRTIFPLFRKQFEAYGVKSVCRNPFEASKPRKSEGKEMSIPMYAKFAMEFFGQYREDEDGQG